MHFDWKDSKWTYGDLQNVINDELSVKNKDGERVQLKFLSADAATEMLGVFLAPDGNNKAQIAKMTQKAISAGEKIKCSNLERNSAWTAL